MKKSITLILMSFLLTLGANAQNYRKWDFSNWSAATIANLLADAAASSTEGWSDIEKAADAGAGKVAPEATAGKCFWEATNQATDEGATLVANGEVISELEGLLFVHKAANRNLAIAVNYGETSLGTYHGGAYLWLGGSKKDYFIIPNVKPGQPIKMGVESHKPSDARGVELYIYSNKAKGTKLTAPDGSDVAVPTVYEDQEWAVPSNAEGQNAEGNYDILVYNTNGCHIYYIEVGTSDQKSKIAYLYQGATDGALAVAQGIANYEVDPIDVESTTITADQMKGYDAVIVAANIAADNAAVSVIKEAIAWTPIVNTNAALYAVWGYGEPVTTETSYLLVSDTGNALFRGIELTEDDEGMLLPICEDVMTGVALGNFFQGDVVPASPFGMTSLAGAHIHNNGHNSYIYVPFAVDATDEARQLLSNAISMAANSKSAITATPAPSFTLEYKNMQTIVGMKCSNANASIYYSLDGSTPTEGSTLYTAPIEISTEGVIVKAVALAEGYLLSEVAEKAIDLKTQAAAPAVSVDQSQGKTTVTISGEGDLWYNYSGNNDTLNSTKYVEPFVLTMPRTVYAFAVEEGKVNSDATSLDVHIDGYQPRIDILSHMDANSAEYNNGSTSTAYYFSWGKNKSGENGHPYYDPSAYTEESVVNPETGDEEMVKTYTTLNTEEEKDFGNGWMVRSRGQLIIWENMTTGENYGNSDSYNYATVDDFNPYFPATKSYINLADKNTEPSDATFPYNAYIVSTQKFQGPFDIVANIGSIVKTIGSTHTIVLQVSADGNAWESSWQTVGDTIVISDRPRLTTNVTRSYEGADEVYVRAYLCGNNSKSAFYDIYIAYQGEKSKELITGINQSVAEPSNKMPTAIYNLAGQRLSTVPSKGIYIRDGKKIVVK